MQEKKQKFWSQPLRVETPDHVQLITSRCINSALWFVNNQELEERIYAFLAKYVEKYKVELYNFQLVGNHYHILARFPGSNMAHFFRDFNARIAESVKLLTDSFEGGPLFERRYCNQVLPEYGDIEDYFFYIALQPVTSGLCAKISEYPGRSFFNDAVSEISREYKYFSYGDYYKSRLKEPTVKRHKFWMKHTLSFQRLPNYKKLKRVAFKKLMHEKLEQRRIEAIQKLTFEKDDLRFMTKSELRKVRPGTRPMITKKGGRRPLVLAKCPIVRKIYLDWYFRVVSEFKEVSKKYRAGDFQVNFPPGNF